MEREGGSRRTKTEEGYADRSKLKKVEMPVFDGEQLNSWLFRAERYFDIHQLFDLEKITVTSISFMGAALHWYRGRWARTLYRLGRIETPVARLILTIAKRFPLCWISSCQAVEPNVGVQERFKALSAPLPHLTNEVLESTFLNGLDHEVRAEVICYEPKGRGQIMRAAQKVEDKI